jgi:hypothetical protein
VKEMVENQVFSVTGDTLIGVTNETNIPKLM